MAARTTSGISFDLVTTASTSPTDGQGAQAPLGFTLMVPQAINDGVRTADAGDQEWIYVRNAEGATNFVAGTVVMRETGATNYDTLVSSGAISPARIVGVAQHTIAAGSFGFILRKGLGQVLCDGNVTADTAITPDANAGQCTDVSAVTSDAFGVALATDSGAASLVTAALDCQG